MPPVESNRTTMASRKLKVLKKNTTVHMENIRDIEKSGRETALDKN